VTDLEPGRELEQELRDERARRRAAESRIEELTERADLWKKRAEERSERITRILEDQRAKGSPLWPLRRLFSKRDQGEVIPATVERRQTAAGYTPTSAPRPSHQWPSVKSVVSVSLAVDPGITRCLSSFDDTDLTRATSEDLDRADLVVIDPEALAQAPAEIQKRLAIWSREVGRQRLLWWTSGSAPDPTLIRPGDVTVANSAETAHQHGLRYLPGCLDPALHRPDPEAHRGGSSVIEGGRDRLSSPPLPMIEAAASGVGFDTSPGAGTAARRWAYRHHSPWVRAHQLLNLVGLRAAQPIPRVAAILVSHRPEFLPAAINAVLRQTHLLTELVVGVHGASPTAEIDAILTSASIPIEMIELDRAFTLGECLNLAISKTSAPILAKIDDDDHYGPAHIEDSFHTLAYSGADVVGKGAHYTYVASRDSTILRRPGPEEKDVDGSPNGATLVFHRKAWDQVGFPHRPRHVDTGFLRAAREMGAQVYVGSRWEFCYVRNPEGHTWETEDEVFLAGSEPSWEGFHPERVEVPDVEPD